MQLIILAALAAALAEASPVTNHPQSLQARASGPQLANFDDLVYGQPIPVPYNGLGFTGLVVSDTSNSAYPVAQSPPNVGVVREGTTLTVAGTDTTSFDLESFYIGCFDAVTTFAPTACRFTVTGCATDSCTSETGRVGPYVYEYSPAGEGRSSMMKITPNGFNGLIKVNINLANSEANGDNIRLTFDDFAYTTR
ncbi:hypothetical protein ACLMJK_006347 [Lecanora helva]